MLGDEPSRVISDLRDRLSKLSQASVRINESLHFETVLQEVLDGARSLTSAKYGVIVVLDDTGGVQNFLGSGLSDEESRQLWELPSAALFEYLREIEQPLRLRDFHSHLRSLGLPELRLPMPVSPSLSFLAAPVRHRRELVANFYLGEKEGASEFTSEDEETLVMFASQVGLVVANARRHRDEQRARADLETLVNTVPVGVLVLDARTGAAVSVNREARRIVEGLLDPDQRAEDLLEAVAIRRADGTEFSLEELPLAEVLRLGQTVRAEEIVIEAPNGRSVTTLVNATPKRSDEGEVESFVVTMQDMTPVEELERLRAEFLAMVSHELRTPLTSIKGSVTTLLDRSNALSPAETAQFHQIIDTQTDRMRKLIADLLDVAHIEVGTLRVSPEPADLASLVAEAVNSFESGGAKHRVHVEIAAGLPFVMADKLRMVQVLSNLFANAARYSHESSPITVTATDENIWVAVSVTDEGQGVTAENLPRLFRKFSRLEDESQGTDTGLGLAICKGIVEAHGGRIWAESDGPGKGACFTFTIPAMSTAGGGFRRGPSGHTSGALQPGSGNRVCVLAVDDDPQALTYIGNALSKAGYAATMTANPDDVPRLVEENKPQIALLDFRLPGTDGIELMTSIKQMADVPVIFLSAYGQDEVIARAFDMGAADYVVKPFSPTELAARIRAALRKQETPEPSGRYVMGDLAIHYDERRVEVGGRPVRLTAIEFRTLAELSANAPRVLTYEHLLRRIWGMDRDGDVRPMRTVISTIRRKLDDKAENPTYIFTEPRVGYRMATAETP